MSTTPQLICPRCGEPLKDLEPRGAMPAILDGEIVQGEWVEHTPKRGCGKWLWRKQKVKAQ